MRKQRKHSFFSAIFPFCKRGNKYLNKTICVKFGGTLAVLLVIGAFIYTLHGESITVSIDRNGKAVYTRASVITSGTSKDVHVKDSLVEMDLVGVIQTPATVPIKLRSPSVKDKDIVTDILYVDDSKFQFSKASIKLNKIARGTRVNALLYCSDENFNASTMECRKWDISSHVPKDLGYKVSFEVTHFSAVAGAYLEVLNLQSNLTRNDIWTARFRTYGVKDLFIRSADARATFGEDIEFQGLYCGARKVDTVGYDDGIMASNYSCEGEESRIENRAMTGGVHKLAFIFGDNEPVYAKNFACDSGSLSTTCTVSTSQTMSNGEEISGTGNLTIASGGTLTAAAGNNFGIRMTGGSSAILIQSGGAITGNLSGATSTTFTIDSGGSINLDGKGFAAGAGTGTGTDSGGGAGHGGRGGALPGGPTYGSTTTPTSFGSGGITSGGGANGGLGGGAVKIITSGTLTVHGSISTAGTNGASAGGCCSSGGGGGAGGSVYVIAGTIEGSGSITANGGTGAGRNGGGIDGGGGGGGRVAIYASTFNLSSATISVNAGSTVSAGNAGTIYMYDSNASRVIIQHEGPMLTGSLAGSVSDPAAGSFQATITNATTTVESINAGWLTINTDVVVPSAKTFTVASTTISNTITTITGTLTATGKGYAAASGPGSGSTSAGGGHGGRGGASTGGVINGTTASPSNLGSGGTTGGGSGSGAPGGGAIKISASGILTVNGTISTNGNNGTGAGHCCSGGGGGGAGGSIYLTAVTLAGSGSITANGGNGVGANGGGEAGGGGGGGRIAFYYKTKTFSGTSAVTFGSSGSPAADAGTTYDDGTPPLVGVTAFCSTSGNSCTSAGTAASPQQAYSVTSIAGTSEDSQTSISDVTISIKDTHASVNKWYGGSSFNQTVETFFATNGATSAWSFNSSSVPWVIDHTYDIRVRAANAGGTVEGANIGTTTRSFVFSNSPPTISNVTATQSNRNVTVSYGVTDVEQSVTTVHLFYSSGVTLNESLSSSDTTAVTLTGTSLLPSSGTILVDDEMISYTATSSNDVAGTITRGANDSRAATHSLGASIWIRASTTSGTLGANITHGSGKSIVWDGKTDVNELATTTLQMKVMANDHAVSSNIGQGTSANVTVDFSNPTNILASSVRSRIISTTSFEVTWLTNEASNSVVDYGATNIYGATATSTDMTTTHAVTLSNLSVTTRYFFRIKSYDAQNNLFSDDNNGLGFQATTTATEGGGTTVIAPDRTPPAINNVKADNITENSAEITWKTSEAASSLVAYGLTSSYSMLAGNPDPGYTNKVVLTNLQGGTTYHYQVIAIDETGNKAVSSDAMFKTLGNVPDLGAQATQGSAIQTQQVSTTTQAVITNLEKERADQEMKIKELEAKIALEKGEAKVATQKEIDELRNSLSGTQSQLNLTKVQLAEKESKLKEQEERLKSLPELNVEEKTILNSFISALRNLNPTSVRKILVNAIANFPENVIQNVFKSASKIIYAPPSISGAEPQLEVNTTVVKVSWLTDKEASSLVAFAKSSDYRSGESEPYTQFVGNADEEVISHYVEIKGLESNTEYHYQIRSKSAFGGSVVSLDATFKTLSLLPKVTDIKIKNVGEHDAMISFRTNVPTDTTIEFANLADNIARTQGESDLRSEHEIMLENLEPKNRYKARVKVRDEYGQESVSSYFNFTTSSDVNPPEISKVTSESTIFPGKQSKIQTIISWETDEPSTSRVYYQEGVVGSAQALALGEERNLVTRHVSVITRFKAATVYKYWVESEDEAGNRSRSKDFTILTPQEKETVVDLMIKNFEDTFQWTKRLKF